MEAELRLVKPKVLVCLGSTAAQAIFGASFRVTRQRGVVLSSEFAARVVATVHPSSLLRQTDEEARAREYALFVADLKVARKRQRCEAISVSAQCWALASPSAHYTKSRGGIAPHRL